MFPGKGEVNRFWLWAIEGGKEFCNTSVGNSAFGDSQLVRLKFLESSTNKHVNFNPVFLKPLVMEHFFHLIPV